MSPVLDKLHKPLAVCSVCSALSNAHEQLNQRCHGTFNGRRCYGVMRSGVSALWDECESCHATGKVGPLPCRECESFGWKLYA